MLTPEYLDSLPEPVLELFRQVEEDILEDMARRISKMGAVTETADWQRWRLEQIQLTRSDITERLSKLTGLTQQELRKLFQEAATQAVQTDNEIYRAAGLSPGSPNDSPELLQLLNGGMQQTSGTFQNLTRTTANTATRQFERALDRAWLQVSSGAFNYQSAIRTAIKSLASTGMQAIQYPTGHVDTLEVAVRRAVLTGVGKTTGEICLAHAEEMGCDLMEITAHPGARPSHMEWQGKIVSLSGRNGYLSKSDIGYGTGDGFKGWNCRHDWFPFFDGLSESAYPREKLQEYESQTVTYNGKTLSYYDATQQQRYIERQIRRWKREYLMMNAAGQDTTQASMKLAQWRATEKDFCKQTGLDRDGFRSQAEGFGRSQAAKATAQGKKYFQTLSSSQVQDYMASFSPEFSETRKVSALHMDIFLKRVKNSKFSLWAESSLQRKNGAISITERYMREIQDMLPEGFEIPPLAVVDFQKNSWKTNAIGGYDPDSGIIFFNSRYDTEAKILDFVRRNAGEFANTTKYSPFLHELGHKNHYDLIQRLANQRKWSYNKAETYIQNSIADYVSTQKAMDLGFVSKQISTRADYNFNELMAEWFASSKDSDLGQFISDFVKGLIV